MNIKSDLKNLNSGILPNSLQYKLIVRDPVDPSMIQYNSLYNSFDYHRSKFTMGGYMNPVIQYIADHSTSPLHQMLAIHRNDATITQTKKLFNELSNNYLDYNIDG